MAHLWSVPDWENPGGLFAELNPKITCRDGTYHVVPFDTICSNVVPFDTIDSNVTMCRDDVVIG